MLPPGHYGTAGRAQLPPAEYSKAPDPLSWRWFFPQSRTGLALSVIAFAPLALFIAALGTGAGVTFLLFGLFEIVVPGIALRKVRPVGRVWRRDPAGAALVGDERSRVAAIAGVITVAAALAGWTIFAVSAFLSG